MKDIKIGKISKNDIQYIISNINCSNQCVILLRINVGSRDESNEIKGISHLLEHMFFQGTEKYKSQKDLLHDLYKYGGDFNAFTSKSETVFYITIGENYIEKAIEILADSFFNSLFLEKNLKKEKKVVINEINQYLSEPNTLMFYGLDEITFKGTRFEKDIGGSENIVQKISVKMIKNFINLYYLKDVILSISGNVSLKKTEDLIIRYFNKKIDIPCQKLPKIINDKYRILYKNHIFNQKILNSKCILKNNETSFIGICFPSYSYSNKNTYKINIIVEILSGYMGSILYTELRNKEGLIYHLDISQESYEDFGQLIISYGTKNKINLTIQSIHIIFKELQKLKSNINQSDFDAAKNNIIETIKVNSNNPYWHAHSYSNDYYHLQKIITIDDIIQEYKKIKINELYDIVKEIFRPEHCNICYTGNEDVRFI